MVSGLNVMVNVGHCRHLLVHVQLLHYPPLTATYTLIGHVVSPLSRGDGLIAVLVHCLQHPPTRPSLC